NRRDKKRPAPVRILLLGRYNASGTKDTGEQLLAWPFCLTSVTDSSFAPVQQSSSDGSCATFSNLGPGTYIVTEGSATGWFGSTNSSTITIDHCGQTVEVDFGNYCTVPSGGLTLGFWSNKNGNKILTGSSTGTGTTLSSGVVSLLNSCQLRNANGTVHNFTNSYSAFRCACTLNPFMCDMCRSRTTQSGRRVSMDFKNSGPEANVSILRP